jgi:hypothetical protein
VFFSVCKHFVTEGEYSLLKISALCVHRVLLFPLQLIQATDQPVLIRVLTAVNLDQFLLG